MEFSNLYEILQFVQSKNPNENITSLCFDETENLVHVELSNGNTYRLTVK